MDFSAYRIDWSAALPRWIDFLADTFTAPRGLLWWPTLLAALVGAVLIAAVARARARAHRSAALAAGDAATEGDESARTPPPPPSNGTGPRESALPARARTGIESEHPSAAPAPGRTDLPAYLRELPVDLACFGGYTFVMVAFAPWLLWATTAGVVALFWLFHVPPPFPGTPGDSHALLLAAAMFIGGDFGLYWSHRLFHALRPLWALHALHHRPAVLTPLTAFRFWPPEAFVHFAAFNFGSGLALGAVCLVAGAGIAPATWMGINVFLLAWYLAFSHLRHSPLPLAFPRALSHVFVSPHMHQAHHSEDPRHRDRNFGTALAVWDWMFGTLYLPQRGERFAFGAGR